MPLMEMKSPRYVSRAWKGAFPESKAKELGARYGFRSDFDLEDRLSEITWRYRRRSKVTPDKAVEAARLSVDKARYSVKIESMHVATLVGSWMARQPKEVASRTAEGHISAAMREFASIKKQSGRAPDLAKLFLFRSLGALYEDGTGNRPSITRSTTRQPRGTAYRFIFDVCGVLGVKVTPSFLPEVGYRRRKK